MKTCEMRSRGSQLRQAWSLLMFIAGSSICCCWDGCVAMSSFLSLQMLCLKNLYDISHRTLPDRFRIVVLFLQLSGHSQFKSWESRRAVTCVESANELPCRTLGHSVAYQRRIVGAMTIKGCIGYCALFLNVPNMASRWVVLPAVPR